MDQMKMYMMMFDQHHSKYQNSINLGSSYSTINSLEGNLMDNINQSTKESNKIKFCKVCGDISKSNHFGALCCCSCKAFFRRSVQNESYKNFHCPYNNNCEITILSRKCCQFCRFEKCIKIGMERSWVMTEEERLQLLKSRMIKKQKKENEAMQISRTSNSSKDSFIDSSSQNSESFSSDYSLINNYLTNNEINKIENLVNDYLISCAQIQSKFLNNQSSTKLDDQVKLAESKEEIIQLFLNCVYQFANFAKKLDFFANLKLSDQQILLRSSIIELCFLHIAYCFNQDLFYRTVLIKNNILNSSNQLTNLNSNLNFINNQFDSSNFNLNNNKNSFQISNQNKENLKKFIDYEFSKVPILRKQNLEEFLDKQLSNKFFAFVKQIQEFKMDQTMITLVILIVLMNPERSQQLVSLNNISLEQEFYLDLLERYLKWKFGTALSSTVFAKLLICLPNLRELAELFAEFQLEDNVLNRFNFEEGSQTERLSGNFEIDIS